MFIDNFDKAATKMSYCNHICIIRGIMISDHILLGKLRLFDGRDWLTSHLLSIIPSSNLQWGWGALLF